MNAGAVFGWVEDHPYAAAAIGLIGLFVILWLLGFFSSSKASTNDGGNMAGAYYAAEAAQAAAGAQIQTTTLQTAAATAIAARQAQMTEAVAATQAGAATMINGQNTGAAMTINAQNTGAAVAIDANAGYTARIISNDQLQSTANTNYWAAMTQQSNNATAADIARTSAQASVYNSFLNNVVPAEIAAGNLYGTYSVGNQAYVSGIPVTPQWMLEHGFTQDEVRRLVSRI